MDSSVADTTVINQNPSKVKSAAGVAAGLAIKEAANKGVSYASQKFIVPYAKKIGQELTEAEYSQLKDAIKILHKKHN